MLILADVILELFALLPLELLSLLGICDAGSRRLTHYFQLSLLCLTQQLLGGDLDRGGGLKIDS